MRWQQSKIVVKIKVKTLFAFVFEKMRQQYKYSRCHSCFVTAWRYSRRRTGDDSATKYFPSPSAIMGSPCQLTVPQVELSLLGSHCLSNHRRRTCPVKWKTFYIQHWKRYNFSEYVQASGEGLTGPDGPPHAFWWHGAQWQMLQFTLSQLGFRTSCCGSYDNLKPCICIGISQCIIA